MQTRNAAWAALRRLLQGSALACLLVFLPALAMAQAIDPRDPNQALTQLRIDSWQTEQGLPLNTVQCLLQTRDGYLWVGTGGGLARFDGVRFVTFDSASVPQVASRPVFGLFEDAAGRLWIGHSDGAIVYRNGVFTTAFGREVTAGRRVWGFVQTRDGAIWAATENGLARWKDGKTRLYRKEDGLPTTRLRSIALDADGTLWLATTGGGLVSFDGRRFEALTPASGYPHLEVRFVLADPAGGVWAATAGGGLTHVARGGKISRWTVKDGLPTDQLTSLARDRDGSLWIGTWGGGVARMRNGRFTSISTDGGLAAGQIWSLHADREGSVWVGTWVGGLNRLRRRDFGVLGSPEGISSDNVRSVLHARNGDIWITTAGGGVNRIAKDGTITAIRAKDGLPSDETSALLEDRQGAIWIGTYTGGVARLAEGRIETWSTAQGLPHVDVRVLYEDREGTLWAGTMAGLARFTGGVFEPVRGSGTPPEGVTAILEDRAGTLWFGTTGQGLFRSRGGAFDTLTRDDGLVSNWIMALYEDRDGNLWIGTNGEGLNRLRNGRMTAIRPSDGLWDGMVQTILEDRAGQLWMTCNRGFYRASRAELDAFADGRLRKVSSSGFGPGDALRSTTFSGGHQPAGAIDARGHLWLPSFSGVVIVDPAHLPGSSGPPAVRLEEVVVNGVRSAAGSRVVLPPGSVPLSIRYTAVTLLGAGRVRFRYRMDGTAGGWVDADRSREASFPALPHGEYRFRVAASVDGRTWREAADSLAITVRPRVFETRWFLALCILGALAACAGVLRLRTRQLRRREAEMARLVAEKTEELRIANEHLARLSFVDSVTGLANRRRFDEALAEEWRRAARFGASVAVIMADVDHFKAYNDANGHPEGDRCLAAVAAVLLATTARSAALVARYGGEEFVVLLPSTDCDGAIALAERLRLACEARAIPHASSPPSPFVTISLGVAAAVPGDEASIEALVLEADAALYRAKRAGRNRVVAACGPQGQRPTPTPLPANG